jgi:hypothetical protein
MIKHILILIIMIFMIFGIGKNNSSQDATIKIKEVKPMGPLFKENTANVLGHDGAYSIPLKDGKVFWTFGDTLIGPERLGYDPEKMLIDSWLASSWAKEHIIMISNTGLFLNTRDANKLLSATPYYFTHKDTAREIISSSLPANRDGRYRPIWPMDGIEVNGSLYIFYLMVDCGLFKEEKKEGNLDINLYGTGLARATYPYKRFERLHPTVSPVPPKDPANACEHPFIWWNNDFDENLIQVPAFGTAVLKKQLDGYIYIYGSKVEYSKDKIAHAVSLARVRSEDLEDVTKYQYLTGPEPNWGKNPKKAIILFEGNANELSVSYNQYLGKYVAVYSYADAFGKDGKLPLGSLEEIHLRTSDAPYGPWSDAIRVYKCKKSCKEDVCYAGKEHPEFSKNNGKIVYVTYVSHQRYFPELIRIEFE